MKFSIIYEAQMVDTSQRMNEAQVFADMVEQCLLAEEMDFDCIWSVEHHCLTQYAHMSAPESFLAFIAGRTKRIHVGHGVVCLPFKMNHPIKVAERVATLDLLSRGRLHFGVGKGGTIQRQPGAFDTKLEDVDATGRRVDVPDPENVDAGHDRASRADQYSGTADPSQAVPGSAPASMYMACTRNDLALVTAQGRVGWARWFWASPDPMKSPGRI